MNIYIYIYIPMKFIWDQSETILSPMQKKIIKIGSQLAKKSSNIQTNKKKKLNQNYLELFKKNTQIMKNGIISFQKIGPLSFLF